MITQSVTFSAGQTIKFFDNATFVRILSASAVLTMRLYRNGTVISESTGVSVGFAEQHEEFFDAFEIYSATAQTIQFAARLNSIISYDQPPTGNVIVSNIPHVIVDTLPKISLNGQAYGAAFKDTSALVANTPITIFTPAANINGAVLHSAKMQDGSASGLPVVNLVAKASAPTTNVDGDVILSADNLSISAGNFFECASLNQPILIPSGKGLYLIAAAAASGVRSVLYTLL